MRTTLLLLLCSAATSLAGLPDALRLSGHLTIVKATLWMDGGSVTVSLRDERGTEAFAGYNSFLRPHAGQLYFRSAKAPVPTHVAKGSADEQALLHMIGGACMNTFGTADPSLLLGLHGDGYWMAWLFLQVERRHRSPPSSAGLPPGARADVPFVVVTGVQDPATVPWTPDLTASKAVIARRGLIWRFPDHAFIIRGAERICVPLRGTLSEGKTDVKLQPGDIVDVPRLIIRIN